MTETVKLEGVGKRYWQLHEQAMLLKSVLPGRRVTKTEYWALRGVDISINPGETVGILGRNGAGKTTMLRLLAGVSRPTEGRVFVRGRIAPLISVGVGFHPEMSGRENVLVNGMLLGLTRRQIESRFDEIVAFAELDDFIDTPVKFYSSGMFMRLGFSVAVHVDPEVMLVDEILAVGDVAFQLKCFQRMRQLQSQGATILFVSHSMSAVRLLCPRAILMRKGNVELDGTAEAAIARHHELLSGEHTENPVEGEAGIRVVSRDLRGPAGPTHHPEPGDEMLYQIRLAFATPVEHPQFVFQVTSEEGVPCYSMQTRIGEEWKSFGPGDEIDLDIRFHARLGGGTYRLSTIVLDRDGRKVLFGDTAGSVMYLAPRLGSGGFVDLDASMHVGTEHLTKHDPLLITGESSS